MSFNISAGVFWKEIDLSNYVPSLSTTQFGAVGLASKGPMNVRTLVTDIGQLIQQFGYPAAGYPALDAAREYLKEGKQLIFVRIQSTATPAVVASTSVTLSGGGTQTVNAQDPGVFYNGMTLVANYSNPSLATQMLLGAAATGTGKILTYSLLGAPLVKKVLNFYSKIGAGTKTLVASDTDGSGALTGTGFTGTINYLTGVVVITYASAVGGADEFTVETQKYTTFNVTLNKTIGGVIYAVEKYPNLSLNQVLENYYVNVLARTNIINDTGLTFATMPAEGTYTFAGGTDGLTGLVDADYIGISTGVSKTGLQLFSASDEVDVNSVAVPGMSSDPVRQALLSLGETRRDCMVLIDPPQGLSPMQVADWMNGANTYASWNSVNSSYAAVYYPWVQTYDPYNAVSRLIPPSGYVAAAFARTDRVAGISYAPAGGTRGKLLDSTGVERILTEGERTYLYQNRVNPISDFIATGILIWGQKTAQVNSSSLDRVVGRRTLNYIEKVVVTALQPLVFEPNNQYTWSRAVSTVQPYLNGMIAKGELIDGLIVCNKTTNTDAVIDRNEMVANIFLKLPKTAEVITLNFVLLTTGAQVSEYIGRQF